MRVLACSLLTIAACSTSGTHATPDLAPTPQIFTVPLSGCVNAHTMPVTIGGGQLFPLNFDTGSSSMGVASSTCASCPVTPLYQPGSFAVDQHATATSKYDTGELGWSGEIYRDDVAMGGASVAVDFAAITSQTSYFIANSTCDTPTGTVASPYTGIVGFGPSGLLLAGTTSYVGQLVGSGAIADAFAVQLCHVGGTLWLGGYDATMTTGALQTVELTQSSLYTLPWRDAIVGATDVALPSPASYADVDSGGAEIAVPAGPFASIAAALEADPNVQSLLGPSWFSSTVAAYTNCVLLSKTPAELDALLPPLVLRLGNAHPVEVSLTATQSYLMQYVYNSPTSVSYCQSIINGTPDYGDQFYYLGQSLMLGHVLLYDRAHGQFGIAPGVACPF